MDYKNAIFTLFISLSYLIYYCLYRVNPPGVVIALNTNTIQNLTMFAIYTNILLAHKVQEAEIRVVAYCGLDIIKLFLMYVDLSFILREQSSQSGSAEFEVNIFLFDPVGLLF